MEGETLGQARRVLQVDWVQPDENTLQVYEERRREGRTILVYLMSCVAAYTVKMLLLFRSSLDKCTIAFVFYGCYFCAFVHWMFTCNKTLNCCKQTSVSTNLLNQK